MEVYKLFNDQCLINHITLKLFKPCKQYTPAKMNCILNAAHITKVFIYIRGLTLSKQTTTTANMAI